MLPTTASGILLRMPMISCVPFPPLTGGFHGTWLLKEGVAVLRKKEPLHDYKAGGLAAVAAVLKHLPVMTLGGMGVGLPSAAAAAVEHSHCSLHCDPTRCLFSPSIACHTSSRM